MTGRLRALRGVTVTTLAATLLAGMGPAQAADTEPGTSTDAAPAAQTWAEQDAALETGETTDAPAQISFYDARNNEHFTAIQWMGATGIATGWIVEGRPYYRAGLPVNRDAMAAFLYRAAGSPDYTVPAVSPFKDVSTTQQFYKEIAWLAEEGIAKGWPDGSYRPLAPVNRDAMAAFLYRAAGSPDYSAPAVSPFRDVSVGQQHYREIAWLASQRISTGWVDGTFRAMELVKRDAMAAFLYRFANPRWQAPTVTTFEKMPTVRNDGFAFRSASVGEVSYADSATRRFDAQEQAVLDFATAATYDRIETVLGIEDSHNDPEALYRVQVYYEDRLREIVDIRPGRPAIYEDVAVDQDRIRFEVTKLAGAGSSTFVLGAARALSKVDPTPLSPERTAPRLRRYFISHFDQQPNESFVRRPEKIDGEYYPNSLSYSGIGDTPKLLEYPVWGMKQINMVIGVSGNTTDTTTQYQVRVLDAAGAVVESFAVTAGVSGQARAVSDQRAHRVEVTRTAGTGEAPLVLGDPWFSDSSWPLQLAP